MKLPSILEMLKAGMHFGHQVSRWHPKMKPFIFTQRNGVHIIDLEKTQVKMKETLDRVRKLASEGKVILFVTTKPQAREIIKQGSTACGMPFIVDRWLGGLLTNFPEMKRLLTKYRKMKADKASGEWEKFTKKEQVNLEKQLAKMDDHLGGMINMEKMPDALFVPALQREKTSVVEAIKTGIEIIAVADTNSNPEQANYFIPGNDDAVNSITMVVNLVAEAVNEGKAELEKNKVASK